MELRYGDAMKPYVTYSAMFNGLDPTDPYFDASSPLVAELQTYTGAWQSYGVTTPIYLVDILDNLGFTTMLSVSGRAVDWGTSIIQNIGIDAIRTFEFPWKEEFGGSDRLDLVLYYCEKLLEAAVPEEIRLDACGDPMDAQGVVSGATAKQLISLIKTDTDALPSSQMVTRYYHWMTLYSGVSYTVPQTTKDYWDTIMSTRGQMIWSSLYKDPFTFSHSDQPSWPGVMPIDATLASNIDYFLSSYDAWMVSTKTQNYDYWWVAYERDLTADGTIDYDYGVFAAQKVIEAADLAVKQVADNRSSLFEIMMLLRVGLISYYTGKRLETEGERSFWNDMVTNWTNGTDYPLKAADSTNASWVAKVASIQAELDSLRVTLLRDATFIKNNGTHGWDAPVTSVDDSTMAYNLFIAVRTQLINTIIARATAYRDNLIASQGANEFTEDSLSAFIRPYLL